MGCCSSKSQIPDPPFQNQSAPQPKKDASTQTKQEPLPQAQQSQPEPLYISPSCQSIMNIFREEEPFQPSGPLPSDHRTWTFNPNTPYISCRVWGGSSESTAEYRAARDRFNAQFWNAIAPEEEDYRRFGSVPELPANFRRQDRSWCSEESVSDGETL
jgi:hypothetical protein